MMEWIEIFGTILGYIATFFGGGWLLNLYMAKPKRNSIEIENLKAVIEEIKKINSEYREETNATIKELKKEVSDLSLRVDIKHEAIYASIRCEFIDDPDDCIVMRTFKEKCEECLIKNKK